MTGLSIIFMGTPRFAVPTLEALVREGHRVLRVVTQPDRPRGRGRRLVPPPVKEAAEAMGLTTEQPKSVRAADVLESLESLKPDALVVAAFGQLVPKRLLDLPRLGPINVHASILPKYRGPAPIQWAIVRGESETGVTTMMMDEGFDTGDILLVDKTPIASDDTGETLQSRLAVLGAELLVKTLDLAAGGRLSPISQNDAEATYAPMLTKADGRIDWNQPPERIDQFVRGMLPWPGAFCELEGKPIKIFRTAPARLDAPAQPGTVVPGFPGEIRVAVRNAAVSITELQSASGKRMPAADFLRGNPVEPGTRLT